jgi:hypothetical protein
MLAYLYEGSYDSLLENIFLSRATGQDWFMKPLVPDRKKSREGYRDWSEVCESDDCHMLIPFLAAVYRLADKYDVQGLKATAESRTATIVMEYGGTWDEETIQGVLGVLTETIQRVPGMDGVADALASQLLRNTTGRMDEDKILDDVILWPRLCRVVIIGQRKFVKRPRR